MTIPEDEALKLVGMVYDAALDQHKWPSFLDAFARAVGGCSSILRSADFKTGKANFVASVGYDPTWQSAYCNHFIKVDYLTPSLNKFKSGEVRSSDQVFSMSEQRKTEMFNDYFIPQDKVHALGTLLAKDDSHTLLFSAQRGKCAGAFGEEQARLMGALAPHVSRAVQVHHKIRSVAVEKEWALGALDQLRMGVILTNHSGSALFVNHAAEQMLVSGSGISTWQVTPRSFSACFTLIQLSAYLFTRLDLLVVQCFLSLQAVALYAAASRVTDTAGSFCRQLANTLTPAVA
jgi:hypothetical protein